MPVELSAARKALEGVPAEPGAPKPDPILKGSNILRTFGGLKAVDVEHIEIQRGVITALIGPNGAGKTTLFNLLTGFDEPDERRLVVQRQRPWARCRPTRSRASGMVRTFQLTKVLSKLKVIENMRLGATGQRGEKFWSAPFKSLWSSQEDARSRPCGRPARAVQARRQA